MVLDYLFRNRFPEQDFADRTEAADVYRYLLKQIERLTRDERHAVMEAARSRAAQMSLAQLKPAYATYKAFYEHIASGRFHAA